MVLLTMTPAIVDGLARLRADAAAGDALAHAQASQRDEPSLDEPAVGKPISHGQILDLSTNLRPRHPSHSLERLLQGARVYVPPPPPRPEPVRPLLPLLSSLLSLQTDARRPAHPQSDEYKALMARLRREEASRAYERMVKPPPRHETFDERFPNAARSFAEANRVTNEADLGDDDVTYSEVHRQVMLLVNFLVSIVGVAVTLWIAARWWSLPARMLLTLGGSIAVAIAEVGVYQAYLWRLAQARERQGAVREVKELVETWVVGHDGQDKGEKPVLLKDRNDDAEGTVRRRARAASKPTI